MTNPPILSREAWVQASHFHEYDDDTVLSRVLLEATQTLERGEQPWVVFDLDSTLYEVTHRTRKILNEALTQLNEIPENLATKVQRGLDLNTLGYSIRDTLNLSGMSEEESQQIVECLRTYWWDRFFSDDYLSHDQPYEGAVNYVQELHAAGVGVAYLTGRDIPRMRRGTVENLRRDGFPIEIARTALLMKPEASLIDCEFKVGAVNTLMSLGPITASFENEPKNLIALRDALPNTLHIFVATMCSDSPALPGQGLFRLSSFLRKR